MPIAYELPHLISPLSMSSPIHLHPSHFGVLMKNINHVHQNQEEEEDEEG
jgi:hypothetical protein